MVFTGSSLLRLNNSLADLSRRIATYTLTGLSFREYLNFTGNYGFESHSLEDILVHHSSIAPKIASQVRVIGELEKYLKKGYYPFFMDTSSFTYSQRVERIVLSVIDTDIPAITDRRIPKPGSSSKTSCLFWQTTFPLYLTCDKTGREIGVSRNQLMKFYSS